MAVDEGGALGLYISIPFCRSKCTYCNFASGVYPASEHERYVGRLIEDIQAASGWAARMDIQLPRRVDTVYLGGGLQPCCAGAAGAALCGHAGGVRPRFGGRDHGGMCAGAAC